MSTTSSKALIIGFGVVGANLARELERISPDTCDKYKGIEAEHDRHDVGFVCVDTPLVDGALDCTEVENAVRENDCEVYVVKSTVPVGYTDSLAEKTGKRVVFSPEYYGATQHCLNFDFDFTILGGKTKDCAYVQQVLQDVYDGRHTFAFSDARTAELAKLMENSWIACKVSFCIDFKEACDELGLEYSRLRELFVLDPRVNPSHTYVYDEHPYFYSHCLDKDVPAAAAQLDLKTVSVILEVNKCRKEQNPRSEA